MLTVQALATFPDTDGVPCWCLAVRLHVSVGVAGTDCCRLRSRFDCSSAGQNWALSHGSQNATPPVPPDWNSVRGQMAGSHSRFRAGHHALGASLAPSLSGSAEALRARQPVGGTDAPLCGVYPFRETSTIAIIPRRIASGRLGHASASRVRSGSTETAFGGSADPPVEGYPDSAESAFRASTAPDFAAPPCEWCCFPAESKAGPIPAGGTLRFRTGSQAPATHGNRRVPLNSGDPSSWEPVRAETSACCTGFRSALSSVPSAASSDGREGHRRTC